MDNGGIMGSKYLVLPRLEVQGANAQSAFWCMYGPPVIAATMFSHALCRSLGITEYEEGVCIIHHTFQRLAEDFKGNWQFRPHQRRGAVFINEHDYSSKNKHALSLQPTASMHLSWSLVIKLHEDAVVSEKKVDNFLAKAKFAGGTLLHHEKVTLTDEYEELVKILPRGFFVIDRSDILADRANGNSLLQTALQMIYEKNDEESNNSWLSLTTLGYAPLTEFKKRRGVREDYSHVYAEPLVGFVQYIHNHGAVKQKIPFWSYGWTDENLFLCTIR
jgi:CRISPR-associated protein Csy2